MLIDSKKLKQAILTIMPERSEVLLIVDNQTEGIVRCKDCEWWGADRMCQNSDSPCFQNGCTHGNWFCADGERR